MVKKYNNNENDSVSVTQPQTHTKKNDTLMSSDKNTPKKKLK